MFNLKNVTILSINTRDPENSVKAIERSCKYINFGEILLLSDKEYLHNKIKTKIIPKINSLEEYSRFCVKDLKDYIETDYCLLIQPDGFVTNPFMWSDDFLKYDYIGAPWDRLLSQRGLWMCDMPVYDLKEIPIIVGNGGFSLRSKKLLQETSKLDFDSKPFLPEDAFIAIYSREILLKNGVKFAPVSVAKRFSLESPIDLNEKNITLDAHFGFHGYHDYKKPLLDLLDDIDNDVECVKIIKKYYET
jgi:hypothetical protein